MPDPVTLAVRVLELTDAVERAVPGSVTRRAALAALAELFDSELVAAGAGPRGFLLTLAGQDVHLPTPRPVA